jgi:hypothetical protein
MADKKFNSLNLRHFCITLNILFVPKAHQTLNYFSSKKLEIIFLYHAA